MLAAKRARPAAESPVSPTSRSTMPTGTAGAARSSCSPRRAWRQRPRPPSRARTRAPRGALVRAGAALVPAGVRGGHDRARASAPRCALPGPLDLEALRRSLDDLIARHSSLRTTIRSVGGRPEPRGRCVRHRCRSSSTTCGAETSLSRSWTPSCGEEARRTFDLEHELPVLVRIVRAGR